MKTLAFVFLFDNDNKLNIKQVAAFNDIHNQGQELQLPITTKIFIQRMLRMDNTFRMLLDFRTIEIIPRLK